MGWGPRTGNLCKAPLCWGQSWLPREGCRAHPQTWLIWRIQGSPGSSLEVLCPNTSSDLQKMAPLELCYQSLTLAAPAPKSLAEEINAGPAHITFADWWQGGMGDDMHLPSTIPPIPTRNCPIFTPSPGADLTPCGKASKSPEEGWYHCGPPLLQVEAEWFGPLYLFLIH